MITSWAQNLEDVVLFRALHDSSNRVFVDVGAGDPRYDSVTALFADEGWRGVNIDAHPVIVERVRADRPRDITIHAAVGDEPGSLPYWRGIGAAWGLSTLDAATAAAQAARGVQYEEDEVRVRVLDELLEEALPQLGVETIAFLKIDVEGLEEKVLAGCSLDRWKPTVVVVEAIDAASHAPTHELFEHHLLEAGYVCCVFDGLNRFYAHTDDTETRRRLEKGPASCLDHYRVADKPLPALLGPCTAAARLLCVPVWDGQLWQDQLRQLANLTPDQLEVVVLLPNVESQPGGTRADQIRSVVGSSRVIKLVSAAATGEVLERLMSECDGVLAGADDYVVAVARHRGLQIVGL